MKKIFSYIKENLNWDRLVIIFILASLLHIVLDSMFHQDSNAYWYLFVFDAIITIVFVIDYIFRIYNFTKQSETKSTNLFLFIVSPGMLIDLLSIIPFILILYDNSLATFGFLRLLRVARLFKLLKNLESNNMLIEAIKSKRTELLASLQIVMLLTIILSSILYYVEYAVQPENFSNIITSFLWSFSKFIGDIGAYGDFAPQTPIGKLIATIVGLLGIAIFAIPAGLVASGFIEEIEKAKKKEEILNLNKRILDAYKTEYLAALQRTKKELGLEKLRKKYISLNDIKYKLKITENELFMVDNEGKNIRIRNFNHNNLEKTVVEYFDQNSVYGTFHNRESKITIVSTHSKDQPFLGHFSYSVAEYLEANFLSIELFSKDDMISEQSLSTAINDYWISQEKHPILDEISNDLETVKENTEVFVFFRGAGAKFQTYNILNGGEKGCEGYIQNGTYDDIEKLHYFTNQLKAGALELEQTVTEHTHYGNNEANNISWFIKNVLQRNSITIHIHAGLLKEDGEIYFKSIKLLAEKLKLLL